MTWDEALSALVIWAADKGYHVEFDKNAQDCICKISKLIEINCSVSTELQVYHLLHECGHAIIFAGKKSPVDIIMSRFEEDTADFAVFRLREELTAWDKGYKLAHRLRIPIEDDKWVSIENAAIKKYIKWASKH